MLTIDCRNVNDALPRLCNIIMLKGKVQESRNGKVRVMDGPTMVKFRLPGERVLFDAERNANPFFHLFEALSMFLYP